MKILKKGIAPKAPPVKIYRGECPLCHCQVEVHGDDAELRSVDDKFDNYVLCPTKGCPQVRLSVKEYITREIEYITRVYSEID